MARVRYSCLYVRKNIDRKCVVIVKGQLPQGKVNKRVFIRLLNSVKYTIPHWLQCER
jgi:hypothetical protein